MACQTARMHDIAHEKYVRLTTFTADGRRKEVPVWIAPLGDGTAGFTTEADSWKVKRIRNNAAVELTPSNMKGDVEQGAEAVPGTASIVEGVDLDRVAAAIRTKYGWQVPVVQGLSKLRSLFGKAHGDSVGVIITLD